MDLWPLAYSEPRVETGNSSVRLRRVVCQVKTRFKQCSYTDEKLCTGHRESVAYAIFFLLPGCFVGSTHLFVSANAEKIKINLNCLSSNS